MEDGYYYEKEEDGMEIDGTIALGSCGSSRRRNMPKKSFQPMMPSVKDSQHEKLSFTERIMKTNTKIQIVLSPYLFPKVQCP